jgi:proteasome lid subunit RPN8/RPN11
MSWLGGNKRKTRGKRAAPLAPKPKRKVSEAVVPLSLVEQAEAFTAPRGHMEMGGLMIGHVDEQGRNVCAVGIFPEQIQDTPSYCEFDGKWMAICAAAADYANTQIEGGSEDTPNLRVIGWIHTHPGLGLFLSGIDIKTYEDNLNMTMDGRFVAVVVDPLEGDNGVFVSPDEPHSYSSASGAVSMDDKLKARYLAFLQRMEEVRESQGKDALPFILCGDLRMEHVSNGNADDFLESYLKSIHKIRKELKIRMENSKRDALRLDELGGRVGQTDSSVRALRDETLSRNRKINARLDKMERKFDDSIKSLTEMFEAKISEMEERLGDSREGNDAEDGVASAKIDLTIHFKAQGCSEAEG